MFSISIQSWHPHGVFIKTSLCFCCNDVLCGYNYSLWQCHEKSLSLALTQISEMNVCIGEFPRARLCQDELITVQTFCSVFYMSVYDMFVFTCTSVHLSVEYSMRNCMLNTEVMRPCTLRWSWSSSPCWWSLRSFWSNGDRDTADRTPWVCL